VAGLADVYGQVQGARGAVERIGSVFGEEVETGGAAVLARVRGEIALHGVSFAFPGRRAALDGVSLRIEAGEHVALVGPNGAGKSTLVQLLLRLHEPQSGTISIDGIDVRTVSLASLRTQVGIVPQQVMLFNTSIQENIACGRCGSDEAAIEAAARAAGAHDFIVRLPQGYGTVVGDGGVRLSGGQQQRLALARALLKDPPILILDEATSMFDAEGEAEFLRLAGSALRGRTVIYITHRATSLRGVDRTLQMREGRVLPAVVSAGQRPHRPVATGG
jgi:ABC-type multidrug transport system fused ATPase/permease subunit